MAEFFLNPQALLISAAGMLLTAYGRWIPFVTPAPVWGYWWVLLFPLLASVALVWKATKRDRAGRILIEAAQLWVYAAVAMILGAGALQLLVWMVLG